MNARPDTHPTPEAKADPQVTSQLDTVARAAATPDEPQPYAELGMKDDEYRRVREILGRRPTSSELAIYSVMWSEHCSYKSSKVHLRQFATKAPKSDALLVGMGENAGVVDIGRRLGRHLQDRVAQPPVVRGAAPGARRPGWAASCATSCRWAPARSR